MPEYVYALHDFQPEHEDEVPFLAGEQIEIVEKDDLYGDGWWQASPVHYYIYHVCCQFLPTSLLDVQTIILMSLSIDL